ncbi:hypothetical protein ACQY0O_005263 [Thecaphora frezii]
MYRPYRPRTLQDSEQSDAWEQSASTQYMSRAATSTNKIDLPHNRWGQRASARREETPQSLDDPYPVHSSAASYGSELWEGGAHGGGASTSSRYAGSTQEEQYIARIRQESAEPAPQPCPPPSFPSSAIQELTLKLAKSPFSSSDLYYHLAAQQSVLTGNEETRDQIEAILTNVERLRRRELEYRQQHELALEAERVRFANQRATGRVRASSVEVIDTSSTPQPSQTSPSSSPDRTATTTTSPSSQRSVILPSTRDRSSAASIWAVKSTEPRTEQQRWERNERARERDRRCELQLQEQDYSLLDDGPPLPEPFVPTNMNAAKGGSGWLKPVESEEQHQHQHQQEEPVLKPTSPRTCPEASSEPASPSRSINTRAPPGHYREPAQLTERELDVLNLIYNGPTNIATVCQRLVQLHQQPSGAGLTDVTGLDGRLEASFSSARANPPCAASVRALSRAELEDQLAEKEAELAAHRSDFCASGRRTVKVVAELVRGRVELQDHLRQMQQRLQRIVEDEQRQRQQQREVEQQQQQQQQEVREEQQEDEGEL